MELITTITTRFAEIAWGPWLLILLVGGGLGFLIYSGFTPFRYLGHAVDLLRGKYDNPDDPGHINHAKALSSALAGTIGMGNIAGVALAISIGGPGSIFWMWVTAVLGIATKFFTCSLAVMYRGKDSAGDVQGGPMYVIREGLPRRYHFLAYWFAGFGIIASLPALQSNQLIQIFRDLVFVEYGVISSTDDAFYLNLGLGIGLALITAGVVFGGLQRIAKVASAAVPSMSILYMGAALFALLVNIDQVPAAFALILADAFTGEAAASGGLLTMILYGIQRGAFSNEAGIGTESLAHGAAKTKEPIREGLVAMTGPIIDTLLICTTTALMILVSGVWTTETSEGVTLTAAAFATLLGPTGTIVVFVCVLIFASTTIFTYSFYGTQCTNFLFGAHRAQYYNWAHVSFILLFAVISIEAAVSLIDGCFAFMAVPTMVSAFLLAPRVKEAAAEYFGKLESPPRTQQTN
ncbi:MAG: alanine/glycine:cation symporter family protein [Pseudomonadota bacterium]